jgi:hypothetical protein
MAIHVAFVELMQVDSTGNVIRKETGKLEDFRTNQHPVVTRPRSFSTEHRIQVDVPDIPNSAGNPTIKAYLILEDAAGFPLVYMDQYIIVTQS